jgi:methylisocitrate lyase
MMMGAAPVAGQRPEEGNTSTAARLQQLFARPGSFYCLAAYDGPSARLVEISGFDSIYVGGSQAAMEKGMPDWGMTSTQEILEFCTRISNNVDIPVIGDCDNGGGSPVTVYRATKDYERAGLAGCMFEDRIRLEKIGQRGDVVSTSTMVDRIHAAVDARSRMAIVARTDSLAVGRTLDEAIERCQAYAEAGADAILIPGNQPLETIRRVTAVIKKPFINQMGADSAAADAIKAGVKVLFYTSSLQDIALAAYLQALTEIKTTGMMPKTYEAHRLPREITPQLEHSAEILARAKKYNVAP